MYIAKQSMLLVALSGLFCVTAAGAAPKYWEKVFTSEVTITDTKAGSSMTSRTVSDGKGHMRIESKSALGSTVTIMDYPKKTMTTIIENGKLLSKSPLVDSEAAPDANKKKDLKDLGTKTVNGHPCKGESYGLGSTKCELWTGTDINYPVKTTIDQVGGKVVTELKSYSTAAPPASSFDIPTAAQGYKVVGQ